MKIGILTYHAVYNFGANLQALSTYNYLKNNGYSPIVIDFFPQDLESAFSRSVPNAQASIHEEFVRKNFTLTKRCRNSEEVATEILSNKLEAVIIGSDAVAQHFPLLARIKINPSLKKLISFKILPVRYETNFPNPFWGEFLEFLGTDIPVAMMSVSCQDTDYKLFTTREKKEIAKIIEKLKYISVRDTRTKDLFRYVSENRCSPLVTPDPVFAFNDNYIHLPSRESIIVKYGLPEKYILLSFSSGKFVDKDWIQAFQALAMHEGFSCVALSMPEGIRFSHNLKHRIDIPLDPLDWYCLIKYSNGYVGEKMHPVISALHNNVPVFSFDHYGVLKFKFFLNQEASKIYHILKKSGFGNQRVQIARKFAYKAPDAEHVLRSIISFDMDKCKNFSDQMRNEYRMMMQNMLMNLCNK